MGTVFNEKGYKFYFVSADCNEPMHLHVLKAEKNCKFWIKSKSDVTLSKNYKFTQTQLNEIKKIISVNYDKIKKEWEKHCSKLGAIMDKETTIKDPYAYENMPKFKGVSFTKTRVRFTLSDKRVIEIPLSPRLKKATAQQRKNFEISNFHVFWDDIDEIIGIKNLLDGSFVNLK